MCVFGIGCIVYGGYLNKTKQNIKIGMLIISLADFDFSFIPNKVKSISSEVERFDIDITFTNFEKLRYRRNNALKRGIMYDEDQEEIPAKIRYKDKIYPVDISLTGLTDMHFCDPNKWSLSVKVKKGETIEGMRKFALLVPRSRGYLTDWIATTLLKSQGVIGIRSDFINLSLNGKNIGLYYLEERYDKRLIENNSKRAGIIFRINDEDLSVYGMLKVLESEELNSQYILLKKLWISFLSDKIEPDKLFDLKKLATFAVITDIMNNKHALAFENIRFYFNPITTLCEPIGREWGYLQEPFKNNFISLYENKNALLIELPNDSTAYFKSLMNNQISIKLYHNIKFKELYIKEAERLSKQSYLDNILLGDNLNTILEKVYKENPFYKFPIELLHENQKYIRDKIHPIHPIIEVYFDQINKDCISLFVKNKIDLPVMIHYLRYNSEKKIMPLINTVKANFESTESKQIICFPFKHDFNLTSFSSDSIEVYYSILGLSDIKKTIVYPSILTKEDFSNLNPTRQTPNFRDFKFLTIDDNKKQIRFSQKICKINKHLIIPQGYKVTAIPGCIIDILNSSRIISYSPFLFFGKQDSIITITSADSTGQGIIVFLANSTSEFSFVKFNNLSNISGFGWDLTGAITFYESPLVVDYCVFENNFNGDDFLNMVRTDFNIQNSTFINTYADALDADFCNGTLRNVKFLQPGNDGIDVSGTNLQIDKVLITNPGDKGISAGEGSHIICNNSTIEGGEIAIASKDKSIVEINMVSINSSKIGYCAYQKKPEYGIGEIISTNSKTVGVDMVYLIEKGSMLTLNGRVINEKSTKVKEMLYGAEYGKASK